MKRKSKRELNILQDHQTEHQKFLDSHGFNTLDVATTEIEKDLMKNLDSVGYKLICPRCRSKHKVKNGFSVAGLQRYKCKNCKMKYTIFTDTVLGNARYPLPVILDIIYYMMHECSLREIQEYLDRDYPNTYSFNQDNLGYLRIKIMSAIHEAQLRYFKNHPLKGIVQIDETYFHENQSGTKEKNQYNPHEDLKGKRKSLVNKKGHSKIRKLSTNSDDFSNVVVAVSNEGLAIGSLIGIGATGNLNLKVNIMDYIDFDNVDILCTDGAPVFREYGKNTVHYILRSSYYNEIRKVGATDALGHPITEETLFNNGDLGCIIKDNRTLNFEAFMTYVQRYHLSLNRVNQEHANLKKKINTQHNSVVTKNLQAYVSWYCFLSNYPKIFGGNLTDYEVPLRILAIILQQSVEEKKIVKTNKAQHKKKIDSVARISHDDLKKIMEEDKALNESFNIDDTVFTYSNEAHRYIGSPSEVVKRMRKGELLNFAAYCGVKNASTMSVNELRSALLKVDNLKLKLNSYDVAKGLIRPSEDISRRIEDHNDYIKKREKEKGHKLSPKEVFEESFAKDYKDYDFKSVKNKNPKEVLFLDTETTGVKDDDEILELAIINGYGEVLFHHYFKPIDHTEWKEAENINHISPNDVVNEKPISNYYTELNDIFKKADMLIIYNVDFDIKHVKKVTDGRVMRKFKQNESNPPKGTLACCMKAFKSYTNRKTSFKLVDAIKYFNLTYDNNKLHGALYDAEMTRQVWLHIHPTFYKGL